MASREDSLAALRDSPGAYFMRRDLEASLEEDEQRLATLAGSSGKEALIHALAGRIGALREALQYVKPQENT